MVYCHRRCQRVASESCGNTSDCISAQMRDCGYLSRSGRSTCHSASQEDISSCCLVVYQASGWHDSDSFMSWRTIMQSRCVAKYSNPAVQNGISK